MCKWRARQETRKLMSCVEARKSFPQLVVSFLQRNLDIHQGAMSFSNPDIKFTRAITKWAIQEKVSFDPKVKIVRDLELERYILQQATAQPAARPINQRRATQNVQNHQPKKIGHRRDTAPVTLKNVTSIPFGARGRKRGTANLIFIGTNPDPDGHQIKNDVPIQSETNTPKTYAARSVASAARSLASAALLHRDSIAPVTSTPMATTSRHEIQPIPFDLSTTIDMDSLDMSVMGRLAYSSSSDE